MTSASKLLPPPSTAHGDSRRVLAIGVFDLMHVGHLRYLQYASAHGNHLTVAVSTDAISLAIKQKLPVVPQEHRLEMVRGMRGVDEAWLQPASTEYAEESAAWISAWRVDLVVAGGGWKGGARWARLVPLLSAHGIEVIFAPATEEVSTTALLEQIRQPNNDTG